MLTPGGWVCLIWDMREGGSGGTQSLRAYLLSGHQDIQMLTPITWMTVSQSPSLTTSSGEMFPAMRRQLLHQSARGIWCWTLPQFSQLQLHFLVVPLVGHSMEPAVSSMSHQLHNGLAHRLTAKMMEETWHQFIRRRRMTSSIL